jgi:hypothetical protein
MKKRIFSIAVLSSMIFTSVTAQESEENKESQITSSKGEIYLPEAHDFAIGFDALPLINTIGKMVSAKAGATAITGTGGATNYISGKYFINEKTAFRAILGINAGSKTDKVFVADVLSATTPPARVTDSRKITTNSFTFGGGIEKRRGKTRLQGYCGGLLMITLGSSKTEYNYGNILSATNTIHTASFNQVAGLKLTKNGNTFGIMLNGLVGAEYFLLPKVSVGAEYWWGVGFTSTGNGKSDVETWNGLTAEKTTTQVAGNNSFGIGGQYGTAALFVNLHF